MIPNFKHMVVGHYNFIDTEVHGKESYDMLREIKSFKIYTNKQVTLYNNMRRIDRNG